MPDEGLVAEIVATDACGDPAVRLLSVTSSEPDDTPGGGDGHTSGDVQNATIGEADSVFELRAERAGSGDGRVYEIIYGAIDSSGQEMRFTVLVTVSHSQSGVTEPIELSIQQDAEGTISRWAGAEVALHYNVIRGRVGSIRQTESFIDLGTGRMRNTRPPARPSSISSNSTTDRTVPMARRALQHPVWSP